MPNSYMVVVKRISKWLAGNPKIIFNTGESIWKSQAGTAFLLIDSASLIVILYSICKKLSRTY